MTNIDSSLVLGLFSGLSGLIGNVMLSKDDDPGMDALFNHVFYKSNEAKAIVGLDMKPVHVNRPMERFLGYSEFELKDMTFPSFTHPQDIDTDVSLFTEIIEGIREDYFYEKRWIHKKGHAVGGILYASGIFDRSTKELRWIHARVVPEDKLNTDLNAAITKLSKAMDKKTEENLALRALDKVALLKKPFRVIIALFFLLLSIWMFIFDGADKIIDKLIP